MLAKKTSKNQLTLPRDIVKAFPDAQYFDVSIEKNRILLVPVKITRADASLEQIREKMKTLGISDTDVHDAVRWARKRKNT
jgi:hypothetical protein